MATSSELENRIKTLKAGVSKLSGKAKTQIELQIAYLEKQLTTALANEQGGATSSDETKTRRIITPVENAPLDLLGSAGMSLAMPILKRVLPPVIGVVAVIAAAVWLLVR